MGDTLRSIVEELLSRSQGRNPVAFSSFDTERKLTQLLAQLSEYEKVDLVKKWRFHEDGVCEHVRLTGCDDKRSCHEVDAAQLETWLAVNLERIKAQARLEEAKWWLGPTEPHGFPSHDSSKCIQCQRIAALEAQAKEKP